MIREPYNINPYNSAKDLSRNPQFSFTFGGDALIGYDYKILSNDSKDTVISDWKHTATGSSYIPTLLTGTVSNPTNLLSNPTTIYNDETYYFNCSKVDASTYNFYNNKGMIWKLRLFENNLDPSNTILTGEASKIFGYDGGDESNHGRYIKGSVCGVLEDSETYVFDDGDVDTASGTATAQYETITVDDVEHYYPKRWMRNVLKANNEMFPILGYETQSEAFYNAQKSGTYYVGTKMNLTEGTQDTYYSVSRVISSPNVTYPTESSGEPTATSSTIIADYTRKDFSALNSSIKVVDSNNNIKDVADKITKKELGSVLKDTPIKTERYLNSYYIKDGENLSYHFYYPGSSIIYSTNSSEGDQYPTASLYRFTILEYNTYLRADGSTYINVESKDGSRKLLGLNSLLVGGTIWDSQYGMTTNDELITQDEGTYFFVPSDNNTVALCSTYYIFADEQTYSPVTVNNFDFNVNKESLIYTSELDKETIRQGRTIPSSSLFTRSDAISHGFLASDAATSLYIWNTSTDEVSQSNTYFTSDEISNFTDGEWGIYHIGVGVTTDSLSYVYPRDAFSLDDVNKDVSIPFSILSNYYDSNWYYFTNQIKPTITFSIDSVPYYSYNAYITLDPKPTTTESGLANSFTFLMDEDELDTLGAEFNPIVPLQRFCPIVTTLSQSTYNFKYYTYKIYGGILQDGGAIIYDDEPLKESQKIFSRNVSIDYDNYVCDYDRYKIELAITTSENGIYYYYTYLYPTVDMFENDDSAGRFAFASYDSDKGAARVSWTADNAYPPVTEETTETTYGYYQIASKAFDLKAYSVAAGTGRISFYHKGSQLLNISPLHDFQVSFTINTKLEGTKKLDIDRLVSFFSPDGGEKIRLKIDKNRFQLYEDSQIVSGDDVYVIETTGSLADIDNSTAAGTENQIFQYQLPTTGKKLPEKGNVLAPVVQDLSDYVFHFYYAPFTVEGSTSKFYTFLMERLYNRASEATLDLMTTTAETYTSDGETKNVEEYRLGFYGKYTAGYNAESDSSYGLNIDVDSTGYDTSKYLSAHYHLSGNRNEQQGTLLTGISRINLYGPALYFGYIDVNRRGIVSSSDNFVLNLNDGLVGFSSLDQKVYGYRIYRNSYKNDDVNVRDASITFMNDMDAAFAEATGNIVQDDDAHSTLGSYDEIVDGLYYLNYTGSSTPTKISGAEVKKLVNAAFPLVRKQMDTYYEGRNMSIDFLTADFGVIYDALADIETVDMISNDLIAEIEITNNSISEDNGFYYIYDYNVPARGFFRYQIVPLLTSETYNVLIAKINNRGESVLEVDDECWHMTDIAVREDGSYNPGDTWTFILGVQSAPYTQNFSKTFQTGFARYPKVISGMANYKTTQFQGYLGKFTFGNINSYEDTIAIIDEWNKFAYNHNQVLVKDPKGHAFIASVSASSDTSDIAIAEMPTQVSCTLTQVGDIESYRVYSL